MDPSLWRNLPEQLLERILACLPSLCLCRCRILSKSCNSFISSPHFLSTMTLTHSPLFLHPDCSTYEPLTDRLYHIPLPSFRDVEGKYVPFASAGGLICFVSSEPRPMAFIVCNPITREWRKLPPMNDPDKCLEAGGMVADKDTNSYRVVVAGQHMENIMDVVMDDISTEVYDSRLDKWKTTCVTPDFLVDPLPDTDLCDGIVYDEDTFDNLLAYSLREESWSFVPTPRLGSWVRDAVVQWKGHLFIVGEMREQDFSISSICIWELHAPKSEWVMVDTMPDDLRRQFLGAENEFMSAGCNGFLLLYIVGGYGEMPMLLYDISKKLWRRLPPSTPRVHGWGHRISYEPSLYAAP